MNIQLDTVYNVDCIELMREMVKQKICVDWLITDPPYGISVNNNMGRRKGCAPSDYKKANWDKSRISKEYFDLMFQVSKNQIIWGGNYYTDYLNPSPCWIVWDKKISDKMSFAQIEMAWTSSKRSSKIISCFPNVGSEKRFHPTQKPLQVIEYCINQFTKEGEIIFDPFMGSFTTAVACHKLQRHFIGSEIDKEYFNKGLLRLEKEKAQMNIFEMIKKEGL